MASSFNLQQENPIPAALLQKILSKMKGIDLVRLCKTSKWCRYLVEELQGPMLQRYIEAKHAERELLELLELPEIIRRDLNFIAFGEKYHIERITRQDEEAERLGYDRPSTSEYLLQRSNRIVELIQIIQHNWHLLH